MKKDHRERAHDHPCSEGTRNLAVAAVTRAGRTCRMNSFPFAGSSHTHSKRTHRIHNKHTHTRIVHVSFLLPFVWIIPCTNTYTHQPFKSIKRMRPLSHEGYYNTTKYTTIYRQYNRKEKGYRKMERRVTRNRSKSSSALKCHVRFSSARQHYRASFAAADKKVMGGERKSSRTGNYF